MDSLTHIVLGACIGEAFFEKGFGKKAMFWGALAQSIPDIDFIAGSWLSTTENLLAHRGFTHSVLFALLISPAFALTAERVHRPHDISYKKWLFFFLTEVFLHLFLDSFNNYGIGWLEPFSHHRFSFNIIYVADPFFSIVPGIAFIALIFLNRFHAHRNFWWKIGLLIPFIYLSYCAFNKFNIDKDIKEILAEEHISSNRFLTTPTSFNNWLWYIVSENDSGYYIGYRSVFDTKKQISFHYFPRNNYLATEYKSKEDFLRLLRFSQHYYTIEKWHDTTVFNDLRFGQILGWQYPYNKFAFHYYLQYPDENKTVVQRGRFEQWNEDAIKNLITRIKGN
ncbi:metal-dependent hydrolase [Ferruginibacter albus]|uniref:metal-dependent hydrolase n=1 Tax=Ferruginibacter albus TaxID=2875540 RepID=UPI001CC54D7D|nr:metal-dependent hydrolase [Ferruginibacter albus]UAY51558.1 metal-dependent hydrolase [Ferruginibacter albus]